MRIDGDAGAAQIFVTSSVSSIRPLRTIQGRALPQATPVADWLRERYEALPGNDLEI